MTFRPCVRTDFNASESCSSSAATSALGLPSSPHRSLCRCALFAHRGGGAVGDAEPGWVARTWGGPAVVGAGLNEHRAMCCVRLPVRRRRWIVPAQRSGSRATARSSTTAASSLTPAGQALESAPGRAVAARRRADGARRRAPSRCSPALGPGRGARRGSGEGCVLERAAVEARHRGGGAPRSTPGGGVRADRARPRPRGSARSAPGSRGAASGSAARRVFLVGSSVRLYVERHSRRCRLQIGLEHLRARRARRVRGRRAVRPQARHGCASGRVVSLSPI